MLQANTPATMLQPSALPNLRRRSPRLPPEREHRLVEATVVSVVDAAADADEVIHLDLDGHPASATRAASCLLAPVVGDRVLVSARRSTTTEKYAGLRPPLTTAYVLAVLERNVGEPVAELSVAGHLGNTALRSTAGALHLDGATGLRLTTRKALRMSAQSAELVANKLSATTKRAIAVFGDAALSGTNLDTAVERLTTRAARAFRFIKETDQTRAQHIDARASDTARLSSKTATVVTSAEVVKVDASQVLIG